MSLTAKIPHGEETVTVELTVKELMALAGIRFHGNHTIEVSARKKLNEAIEEKFDIERADEAPIAYQQLV
ncbi:hypothetical protein [Paenibacillus protaetiae]|uniref:Uncharacterized protein n=1 Tax=Paenibacillus protaetiae TaxID=2509456 RepID=A0A4P6EY62_9BACL|nr:hypothetical protein [Paenibacillus protaetiae]QAY66709.1 hypothetical protein ET464_10115 [Paenibacillus protaetiae]